MIRTTYIIKYTTKIIYVKKIELFFVDDLYKMIYYIPIINTKFHKTLTKHLKEEIKLFLVNQIAHVIIKPFFKGSFNETILLLFTFN